MNQTQTETEKLNRALVLMGVHSPRIDILPEAKNAKEAAISAAKGITEIATAGDVHAVAAVLAQIKGLKKLMIDSHEEVKAPVLEISRRIDGVKKDYLAGLESEERRLSLMLGAHQENERRKAEAARQAAEAEAARIKFEAEQAEAKRIAAESKGRTGTLLQDVGAIRDQAEERIAQVQQQAASAAALAPAGTQVRANWKFEVEDIHALYAANPELVKMEPNKAAINAIIKTGRKLPGLRIWNESLGVVKAAPTGIKQLADQYDY